MYFPFKVADFLHTHPTVKDVAAIGVPDERLGEIVAVVIDVVPGKKLTEKEVLEYCEKLQDTSGPERSSLAKCRGIRPVRSKNRN